MNQRVGTLVDPATRSPDELTVQLMLALEQLNVAEEELQSTVETTSESAVALEQQARAHW
jgi:hypothetical protein